MVHPKTGAGSPEAFHQRLRDLSLEFSRGVSSTLSLGTALEILASQANALFGGVRTSVWMHDRRARQLALAASSDPSIRVARPGQDPRQMPPAMRVSTDDVEAPAARGLRLQQPDLIGEGAGTILLAPLRGWRRALGTIVIERPSVPELDRGQLLELALELGRQLSVGIENVQLLEEILRQHRLLDDTFNSLVDLLVVTDNHLRIVQTNEAFAVRVGVARSQLVDEPLGRFIGEEMAIWAASLEPAEDGTGPQGTARTRRFDDERLAGIFSATLTPMVNQDGNPGGRVIVVRDITVQTRLEAEREALRQRLVQTEKLASLGQFVAGIAHEMNNPLQGVLGHLELIIETSNIGGPVKQDLRGVYREADRAAKIVRNLLVFTGSRRMARRRLRIDRVLSRVVASRAAALRGQHIEIVREQEDNLPPLHGDPLLLHQAFLNVVINAEHAIASAAGSGRIEIRTARGPSANSIVTTVRDTGPGIPEEILARIFDPFFTTKEVGSGTGLGLAITYGIVQEHGGTIQGGNAPGGGAVFTIELPAASTAR